MVYANPKQQMFLQSRAKRRTFNGGRGSGKSYSIGFMIMLRYEHLPRGKSMLAGMSFNSVLTKTMPSVIKALNNCGFTEYDPKEPSQQKSYVLFKKPPSHWPKPYEPPFRHEYVITFDNGFTVEILSTDRPDSNRGGSYDGEDLDESAQIKEEIQTKVLGVSVRGNARIFKDNPLHQVICDYTSTPWLPSGQWIYKTEDNMRKYGKDKFLFVSATSLDNIDILGEDYLENMRMQTPPYEFEIEYMNARIASLPNCFYNSFDERKHCQVQDYDYDMKGGLWVPFSKALNKEKGLLISVDWNAAFSSLVVAQDKGKTLWIANCLFVSDAKGEENVVKNESMVSALALSFHTTYRDHPTKLVEVYGDRGGHNRQVNSSHSLYDDFEMELKKHGWTVRMLASKKYPRHQAKYAVIDSLLSEKNTRMPKIRFDIEQCKYLIISMQNSGMNPDFTKDKRSERNLVDQRRATHLSDCLDYLLYSRYAQAIAGGGGNTDIYTG
jgi:hypothetical protein